MGILDSLKRKNSVYDEIEEPIRVPEPKPAPKAQPQYQSQPQQPRPMAVTRPANVGALSMQVLRPVSFSDSPRVADCLKAGQAVVLNLEDMDEGEARRMIDYVAGVLYAVDGKIERPAGRTFLLTPKGVNVALPE